MQPKRALRERPIGRPTITNPKSWYPVPERAMFLSAIPAMQPLLPVPMAPQRVQNMRDCAQTFGAAVRQCSVRQETTMARAGTLPSYLYQREVQPGESVSLECSESEEQQGNEGDETEEEDGVLEYDSPSSDQDFEEESFVDDETDADINGEISSLDGKANFHLGTVSRFRRTIRFNNRIFILIV